jgi:signal transduction histidine kinase
LVPSRRFHLTRHFTITSLMAFGVLGAALFFLQRGEEKYFDDAQRDQVAFFARVQADLLQEQRDSARANLVAVHEAGHVALTRVFANALWSSHFAPLVAQAKAIPIEACRPPVAARAGSGAPLPSTQAAQADCIARVRAQVLALPAFAGMDAPVRALMGGTTVFKIKVYDLRGLTVYSSEQAQVGEDKADNAGWQSAVAGKTASELVHRNQFSAFEGVVNDRDLIQSYIPVAPPGGGIGGVFEIYSDVTPLLRQLDAASARSEAITARNQDRLQAGSAARQREVESASTRFLITIFGLLLLTYGALLFFVRRGQRLIDRDARAREQAALREQEWHRDKMATMAAMAANISHEVGNPLAIISGLAEEMGHWRRPEDVNPEFPRMIVEQTGRIANMTRRINDFATAGRDTPQLLDINEMVRSVCDFLKFDRRFHGTPIALRLAEGLPACRGIPDHLAEVLMGLLQAFEQGCEGCARPDVGLVVATQAAGPEVAVQIRGECPGAGDSCLFPVGDPRLESARLRMEGMGGRVSVEGATVRLHLACEPGA